MKLRALPIILIILLTLIPANSAEENILYNEYLKLYFDDIGNIILATKDGKWLTYPDFTSYYTILINGKKYSSCTYGRTDADYTIADINVERILVNNTLLEYNLLIEGIKIGILYSLEKENLHVKVTLRNIGAEAKEVGFRYLLDTQLDENDGAPLFFEDYGVCIRETLIENPSSKGWQAYDKWPNSTLVSYWSPVTLPCRIIFAHWPSAVAFSWDYLAFNESRNFYTPGYIKSPKSDSCVLIYYCPKVIDSGEEIIVEFYYGLSEKINIYEYVVSLLNRIKMKLIKLIDEADEALRFSYNTVIEIFEPEIKDNLKELTSLIIKYISREEIAKSLAKPNLRYLETLADQILRALKSDNSRVWAWVTRKLKYSGLVGILAVVSLGFSIAHTFGKMEMFQYLMENSFTELFLQQLFFPLLKDNINTVFEILLDDITEIYSSLDRFKREYLIRLLENIDIELSRILRLDGSILVVGSNYSIIQSLRIYKERISELKEKISRHEAISDILFIVSSSTFILTKVFGSSVIGAKIAAILALIGVVTEVAGLITKQVIFKEEMLIYKEYVNLIQSSISICVNLENIISFFEVDRFKQFIADIAVYPSGDIEINDVEVVDSKVVVRYNVNLLDINHDNSVFVYFRVINNDDGSTVYEDVAAWTGTLGNALEIPLDLGLFSNEYTFLIELWGDGIRLDWEIYSKKIGLLDVLFETISEGTISSGEEKVFNIEISLGEGDFLMFYKGSEVDLHVYDSEGRHVGVNYDTGEIENEIPGAKYSGNLANPEWVELPPGIYKISVVGVTGFTEYVLILSKVPPREPVVQVFPEIVNITLHKGINSTSATFLLFNTLSNENVMVNVLIGRVDSYITPVTERLNLTIRGGSFTSLTTEFNINPLIETGRYAIPVKIVYENEAIETEIIFNIVILGDLNGDGIINYKDLAILASSYGSLLGGAKYIANADLNGDGIINYKDLAILASSYGS